MLNIEGLATLTDVKLFVGAAFPPNLPAVVASADLTYARSLREAKSPDKMAKLRGPDFNARITIAKLLARKDGV